jgi:HTH-type transcriptional regulator/antitoxin MqsA
MSMEEAEKYGKFIGEFKEQVNAQFVQPGYITEVRKKLHLTKKEASEIFGGGKNGFALYETGQAKPPVSLIKLLKVLDKHPDLLSEVKAA